jgi:hypothetical protein
MNLVHVPIPYKALEQTAHVWMPFIERAAQVTGDTPEELTRDILAGDFSLHLVWEPEAQKAHALGGVRILIGGGDKKHSIAELTWIVGENRKQWLPLFAEFEKFHKEHLGCIKMRARARRGWVNDLKPLGYRTVSFLVEKDL